MQKKTCYLSERKGNYDHHSTVSRVHFLKIGVAQKRPELATQMLKEYTDMWGVAPVLVLCLESGLVCIAFTCIHMKVHYTYMYTHVYVCVYEYICMHLYMYVCVCVYTGLYVLIQGVHPIAHHPSQLSCYIHREVIKQDPAEAVPLPSIQCVRWETHGEPPSHPPLWMPEQTRFLPASCPQAIRHETAEKHQPGASASYTQLLEQPKPKPLAIQSCFQWFQLYVLCLCSSYFLIPFLFPSFSFTFSPHFHFIITQQSSLLFFLFLLNFSLHHFSFCFACVLLTPVKM